MLALSAQAAKQMNSSQSRYQWSLNAPPRPYAVPAQREGGQVQQRYAGLSYTEHEHMRQRKTPHGMIEEKYDPDSLDQNTYYPASKHFLLSSSPDYSRSSYAIAAHDRDSYQRLSARNTQNDTGGVTTYNTYQRQAYSPAWEFPGGLDSVLNQNLPLAPPSQRYYYYHGSNVPTVLPSALNSQFGPTASAGQEVYGPYWPDGTFSPYRPAAVRDDRFFRRHFPLQQEQQPPLNDLHNGHRTLRRSTNLPSGSEAWSGSYPKHMLQQAMPASFAPLDESPANNNVTISTSYNQDNASASTANAYPTATTSPVRLQTGRASEQIAFRDRTFAWANNIYVALLTDIQRNSKLNGHTNRYNQAGSKPVIFPKPPRRTESHFSNQSRSDGSAFTQPRSRSSCKPQDLIDENDRPQTAIYSPGRRASENPKWAHNDVRTLFEQQAGQARTTRRTSDFTGYQSIGYQQGMSVHQAAESALNTMQLLCEEAQFPWVDGMLLAGCLAYGVANYDKALLWYQRILRQDMHHIEAMSNLAATLLALNRRDEALSHWSAAVKLRPSYFEAVEHLIGLLCGNHRTKEALHVIEYVEASLKTNDDLSNDAESDAQSRSSIATMASLEKAHYDFETESILSTESQSGEHATPGFGTSGYAIPGAENGRILALVHAKGNLLYSLGDNTGAAAAFEDAILVAMGSRRRGIRGLISDVVCACIRAMGYHQHQGRTENVEPILISPENAETTAKHMFPPHGDLPGLEFVPPGMARRAAVSTTSNSLLSLAKIYQDGMSNAASLAISKATGTRDILALYYLSLSLQRSPSTANNVGILLAGVQAQSHRMVDRKAAEASPIPGVMPGSGIALALAYYNYGLNLDRKHAHLYTNLGSLLKDIGQLSAAIKMYEMAVSCDSSFDIALANLANAVKDQGRVADAINYYRRAVAANPDFAEAVCGLATALNSVCNWHGRGGMFADGGKRDRIHVDERGKIQEASRSFGWMSRVVEIVEKQLKEGQHWGNGVLTQPVIDSLCQQLTVSLPSHGDGRSLLPDLVKQSLQQWSGKRWEGSRIVRLVERAIQRIGWQWYQDRHIHRKEYPPGRYARPHLPAALTSPSAPTVLPFHTFTAPLSAKQIRQISQRNALRISVSTLRSAWLPKTVYPPPAPPKPCLIVGYVSSDFNNHPLAHLMQSIFGLHTPTRVRAICYATTASDSSVHRQQIEKEAPIFHDASSWSIERLINQIVQDGVHILVNLNGYTRGARNEVFAARPAPLHMSFMGFAGTLGAEWCDYVFADEISVPSATLSSYRHNVSIEDRLHPESLVEDAEDWIYSENVIFSNATFFCVDHKQSAPDAKAGPPPMHTSALRKEAWEQEQSRRWKLRKELFPTLSDSAVILGNFNQLYKIDPACFRMYLRILSRTPNAILWLLRFPEMGEGNLLSYAREWAGLEVASRVVFTDVAPKGAHITRASVVDLFLDTPECNAHTTAADVVWSGTPIITWGKWKYKMCSRMAGSIVASALPEGEEGDNDRRDLLVESEEQYVEQAVRLAGTLKYPCSGSSVGHGRGRLMDLRRVLWEGRWSSRLFDTKRWVRGIERAYWEAWKRWEMGQGGDIWL